MRTYVKVAIGVAVAVLAGSVLVLVGVTGYALGGSLGPNHTPPPSCDGQGAASYCVVDLPDCRELVFTGQDGGVTWYQQDWCRGQSRVD